jgi:hypothetical protein
MLGILTEDCWILYRAHPGCLQCDIERGPSVASPDKGCREQDLSCIAYLAQPAPFGQLVHSHGLAILRAGRAPGHNCAASRGSWVQKILWGSQPSGDQDFVPPDGT